jgi:hypothetical protein
LKRKRKCEQDGKGRGMGEEIGGGDGTFPYEVCACVRVCARVCARTHRGNICTHLRVYIYV